MDAMTNDLGEALLFDRWIAARSGRTERVFIDAFLSIVLKFLRTICGAL